MKINWKTVAMATSLSAASLVGGYYLGGKNATEELIDALQSTCGRSETLMQFPDGSLAACIPLRQAPSAEEKYLRRELDKRNEA